MFSLLLEKEPSEENIPEEEGGEEEAEEQPDEQTTFFNSEITDCFALFDPEQQGFFESKYLKKALRCLGIFLTSSEMEEAEATLSTEGIIIFDKFQSFALEKLIESDALESLKIAFQAFDPEKECLIPNDRFKRWMTTLGDPLTEKEAKELIKLGDPSGKGFIAYDDLALTLVSN